MISRQKITGWALIIFAVGYLLYFLKVRMFTPPALETREWLHFVGMIVILMIGTTNIRMAAMRDRQREDNERGQGLRDRARR